MVTLKLKLFLQGHCECITVLAELLGPEFLRVANRKGDTPAHFAVSFPAKHDGVAMLTALNDAGGVAVLEIRDERAYTPVHWAAKHGLVDSIRLLHRLGCNVASLQMTGECAAHTACLNGQPDSLVALAGAVGVGILCIPERVGGLTPTHAGAQRGDVVCLEVIARVAGGGQLRKKDNNGRTPAHHAAGYGQLNVLEMLYDRGFHETMWEKDNGGHTPWDFAKIGGHTAVMAWLHQKQKPVLAKPERLRAGAVATEAAWGISPDDKRAADRPDKLKAARERQAGKDLRAKRVVVQTVPSSIEQLALFDDLLAAETAASQPAALTRRQQKAHIAAESALLAQQQQAAQLAFSEEVTGACVICLDAVRSVCVIPCNHFIYCEACAVDMWGMQCGVCRGDVTAYISRAEMEQMGGQCFWV